VLFEIIKDKNSPVTESFVYMMKCNCATTIIQRNDIKDNRKCLL
jgi:hypothetical protein